MWSLLVVSLLPAIGTTLSIATTHKDAAPILSSMNAKAIPDTYMVMLKGHVTKDNANAHHAWVQELHLASKRSQFPFVTEAFSGLKHTYDFAGGLFGYAGHFDEATIEEIRRHPEVEFIERDSEVHTNLPTGITKDDSKLENDAPWGLARISHRDGLSFGNFNKYLYASHGGEGVDVYVIDTGTFVGHTDFEGRAEWVQTVPEGDADEDGNGHGTHCSGTIAGKKYGVAKKAHIKAIKVLRSNGSGTMSDVVKGVERAVEEHQNNVKSAKKGFKGSAANMSLGGGKSTLLDKAVNAAVDAGIHFAVAAGNDNADSCNYSPASAEKAVTVGASTLSDERAYFSNYGTCNDIFGPGLNILSTWIGSENAVNTISGTSMASPHIAGLLAYMLSLQPAKDSAYAVDELTPKQLKAALLTIATSGALEDVPADTDNLLAWNGGGKSNYSQIVAEGGYAVKQHKRFSSVDFEKELEALEDAFEDAKSRGSDALKDAKDEFEDDLEELKEDFEKAKSKGTQVWDESREDFEEELEELKEDFEEAKGKGTEFLGKSKDNFHDLTGQVVEQVEDFVDDEKAAFEEL